MPSDEKRRVLAWLDIPGHGSVSEYIEVPESSFNSEGNIIEDDALEFVEIWMLDTLKLRYGACLDASDLKQRIENSRTSS